MDAVASVVDRIKGLAGSAAGFVTGALRRSPDSPNPNPIEILKRLQREAFSDLMKLRDRQDKVERMLSFYKSDKGSPFKESGTHVKGIVCMGGAILVADSSIQQACSALDRSGTRTGVDLKFIFETELWQEDSLLAEFMAGQNKLASGSLLELTKLKYLAKINDCLSMILIPLGAQCHDFGISSIYSQRLGIAENYSSGPPLFNQYHGCAAGVTVKGSNVVASLAELVSGLGMQPDKSADSSLNTFGQVTYQPTEDIKLTLSGLWSMPRTPSQLIKLGMLAIPLGSLNQHISDPQKQASASPMTKNNTDAISAGSIILMLDSEFDESTKFGGWVEAQRSSLRLLQWGISVSDIPEDELGWGLRAAGKVDGHFNLEGFLNLSLGKRVTLQPGVVYVMEGHKRTPAFVLRSSWFM